MRHTSGSSLIRCEIAFQHRAFCSAGGDGEAAAAMTPVVVKRFYDQVTVSKSAPWKVLVDGRPVKTVTKRQLVLPNLAIAAITAAEWDRAESIVLKYMPMTNMGCVAIDRVGKDRKYMEEALRKFVHTDTICYRVDPVEASGTERLYEKQVEVWDPLNEWFAQRFGGEKLQTTNSIVGVKQPASAIAAVHAYIEELCPWGLAALDTTTAVTKSVVIALALAEGQITSLQAVEAARLEEDFQTELYGFVEGGHDWDVATTKIRLASASLVFKSLAMDQAGSLDCMTQVLEDSQLMQQ